MQPAIARCTGICTMISMNNTTANGMAPWWTVAPWQPFLFLKYIDRFNISSVSINTKKKKKDWINSYANTYTHPRKVLKLTLQLHLDITVFLVVTALIKIHNTERIWIFQINIKKDTFDFKCLAASVDMSSWSFNLLNPPYLDIRKKQEGRRGSHAENFDFSMTFHPPFPLQKQTIKR